MIRNARFTEISTLFQSRSVRLSTVSRFRSSFSGSSGGLRQAAAAIAATSTSAPARRVRITADYHSVVTLGSRPTLRVATYNIHRCRGLDGRTRPERIAAVLESIDADVIALQEVIGPGPADGGHAEEIGARLGMGWVMAPARQLRGRQFGNAVLSRLPIAQHLEHDLSWKTCEARRMQRVDIA